MFAGSKKPNDGLRQECDAAGITRAEIASHLGISKSTVDNWFSAGRTIPPAKKRGIVELLQAGRRPAVQFDSVKAYIVRLTPAEYRCLCELSGVEEMSAEAVELALRGLLLAAKG